MRQGSEWPVLLIGLQGRDWSALVEKRVRTVGWLFGRFSKVPSV